MSRHLAEQLVFSALALQLAGCCCSNVDLELSVSSLDDPESTGPYSPGEQLQLDITILRAHCSENVNVWLSTDGSNGFDIDDGLDLPVTNADTESVPEGTSLPHTESFEWTVPADVPAQVELWAWGHGNVGSCSSNKSNKIVLEFTTAED